MKTTVEFDPSYAMLTVDLNPGEIIKAEPGAMVLQEGVEMNTGGGAGACSAASRGWSAASPSSSTPSLQRLAAGWWP